MDKNLATKAPFFILGNPRSGTTLLRLMLDMHSKLVVPPECGFIIWFYNKYKNWEEKDIHSQRLSMFLTELSQAKKIENWNLDIDQLSTYIVQNKPTNYSELVNAIYTYYSTIELDKKILFWGDKNNFHIHHVKELHSIFPDAKFIHIIRDGRDVACSYKELSDKQIYSDYAPKLDRQIGVIAQEWGENNKKIIEDLKTFVSKKNFISVRFEDLVLSPEKSLQTLCNFLSIIYEPEMLNYYTKSKTHEPTEYLQWKAKTKNPPEKNRVGRYKQELLPEEISTFNKIAKDTLLAYDYELC